jgi:hypothetical protein
MSIYLRIVLAVFLSAVGTLFAFWMATTTYGVVTRLRFGLHDPDEVWLECGAWVIAAWMGMAAPASAVAFWDLLSPRRDESLSTRC